MKKFILMLTAAALFLATAASAESVWVKSDKARLHAKPDGASEVVATVKQDDKLSIIKKSGKYYLVKTSEGKKGYILSLRVSKKKKEKSADDLDGLLDVLASASRDNTMQEDTSSHSARGRKAAMDDEDSSSHSVRGLKEGDPGYAGNVTPVQAEEYVRSMETFTLKNSEMDSFEKEGGVGVYAK